MRRRLFLAALAAPLLTKAAAANPNILLVSNWQTINIGDIAHTPGVLAVIERALPGATVTLWPASPLDQGVEPMLQQRFPKLKILAPGLPAEGETPELRSAFAVASVLMHGSAASMGNIRQIEAYRKQGQKPFGYFGVGFTIAGEFTTAEPIRATAKQAAFIFTRERASLANLASAGITAPKTGFAPDGTFSMDILDEGRGLAYLKENSLEAGKFICLIPRLRYTPYHKVRKVDWPPEEIQRRESVNERYAEPDHAKFREAAIAWVRKTGGRVLLCPEMTYELDLIDPYLYEPLPDDVKKSVVRRKIYWRPDEASSIYKRAAAVVSLECHSPILAAAHGTPCVYVHQPEDGIKGHMWEDIGLSEWYFEVDKVTGADLAARVLAIAAKPEASAAKVKQAVQRARKLQDEAMSQVRGMITA